MAFFKRNISYESYDRENTIPVIRSSICNGEKIAGFKDIHSGKFYEKMLIKNQSDIDFFKEKYGINEEIKTIY